MLAVIFKQKEGKKRMRSSKREGREKVEGNGRQEKKKRR
jgi:hypothetical protein